MGRTVIDSLVIELGFDPKGIEEGRKKAATDLLKTREEAIRAAKGIEDAGKRGAAFFANMRKEVIGLYAAFTAGRGIKDFVEETVDMEAWTSRTAHTIRMSTSALTAWQGVARMAGGTAVGITRTMQGLMHEFQQFSLTGQSGVVPYFRAMGIALSDDEGKLRSLNDILLDMAKWSEGRDPARAAEMFRSAGIDEDTINLLLQGRKVVEAYLAEQKKLGASTEKDAAAAKELQREWQKVQQGFENTGRHLLTTLLPALKGVLSVLQSVAEWARRHPTAIQAAFWAITAAVGVLSLALAGLAGARALGAVLTAFRLFGGFLPSLLLNLAVLSETALPGLASALLGVGIAAEAAFGPIVAGAAALGALYLWSQKNKAEYEEAHDRVAQPSGGTRTETWVPKGKGSERTAGGKLPYKDAQKDVDALVKMGWTQEQAIGLVANISRESGGEASAEGDHRQAYGLAQWHKPRQEAFERWAGFSIRDPRATRQKQLEFINYELRQGSETAAGRRLSKTKTAGDAAREVALSYERPLDRYGEAAKRAAAASTFAGSSSSKTVNVKQETHINEINVNAPAAKDAKGVAAAIGPEVRRQGLSQQLNSAME